MYRHQPWDIYNNTKELLKYRKIDTKYTYLSKEEFVKQFFYNEYIEIRGTRSDTHGDREFLLILFAPDSKYITKSPDFKKIIKAVINEKDEMEILLIAPKDYTSHIKKEIGLFSRNLPNIYLEYQTYEKFIIVVPEYKLTPKHEIADPNEIEEFCKFHYINKENLPKIDINDTMVVWMGARSGDIIKITRPSETTVISIIYRMVR